MGGVVVGGGSVVLTANLGVPPVIWRGEWERGERGGEALMLEV